MKTYTASIFVELEIRVSGTLVPSDPPTHDPPYPASDGGWEDLTVEGIDYDGTPILTLPSRHNHAISSATLKAGALDAFLREIESGFSDQITEALSAEVPDGPDPDAARDAAIDRELMG